MFEQYMQGYAAMFANPLVLTGLILLAIWTAVWKGFALWKAAKKNQLYWFIALLVINTMGILEILYIFVFSKMKPKKKK